jgi:hypothetical protein
MGWVIFAAFAAFAAFVAIALTLSMRRMRRGGPGPAVNYVPPPLRGAVNSYYRQRGWQEPFDANGDRNPDRDRI